jgi:hypothetical protein
MVWGSNASRDKRFSLPQNGPNWLGPNKPPSQRLVGFLPGVKLDDQTCPFSKSPQNMPRQAQGGGRDIAPTHLQPSAWRRLVVSTILRPLCTQGKPGTYHKGGQMALGADQDGMKNLAPNDIWSLDHPTHSKSLYPLCYPDHPLCLVLTLRLRGATCLLPL